LEEYNPSLTPFGTFIDKALHGLQRTLRGYSEPLAGFLKKLRQTTFVPRTLSDTVFPMHLVEDAQLDQLLGLWETLTILNDRDLTLAIAKGREDVKKGRVHDFSELLAEYGLE